MSRDAVSRTFERIAAADRPEVWIHLRGEPEALADARGVEQRAQAGEQLPLAGQTLAVKDNIDVAGLPTTVGCPAYGYTAAEDAPCVALLKQAGAVVIGKTNMDQFATGLTGTRTPFGAVRNAHYPSRVTGGSSAGSAVAVALGLVDIALGTDTGGSVRMPAAFQGVVGLKPTLGLVSTRGVVPACRSFDGVGVFAREIATAEQALATIVGPDRNEPGSRVRPPDAPGAAPAHPKLAIPQPGQLHDLSPGYAKAFEQAAERLRATTGAELIEIDLTPFLEAGALLYGAFVAERYAAVGEFIAAHPDEVDPSVRQIILAAKRIEAHRYVTERARLDALRLATRDALAACDALTLPTAPFHPTIEEVAASPLELDRKLGVYCRFANLLDMCGVAVPAGEADGGCFGITLLAPAFHDRVVNDLGARFMGG